MELIDLNHNHGVNTGIALHKAIAPPEPTKSVGSAPKSTTTKKVQPTQKTPMQRPPMRLSIAKPVAKVPMKVTKRKPSKTSRKPVSKSPAKRPKQKAPATQTQAVPTLVLIKQEKHDEARFML